MTSFETFARLVDTKRGESLPLLKSVAYLAQYADSDFDPDATIACVQRWCAQLRERVPTDTSTLNRLRHLNHFFFEELGFHGDRVCYDAIVNSHLHRVIERRCGIPISLAVIYLEIGRAVGLKLFGVSFPGHFLVKLLRADGALFIDAFDGGITLSADELRRRLGTATRGRAEYPLELYLRAASDRAILVRWLRNLKAAHAREEEWPALLEVMNRLVLLLPDEAAERRDRAAVFERLECPRGAADDLAAYLSMTPDPPDAGEIRLRLDQIRRAARQLN